MMIYYILIYYLFCPLLALLILLFTSKILNKTITDNASEIVWSMVLLGPFLPFILLTYSFLQVFENAIEDYRQALNYKPSEEEVMAKKKKKFENKLNKTLGL